MLLLSIILFYNKSDLVVLLMSFWKMPKVLENIFAGLLEFDFNNKIWNCRSFKETMTNNDIRPLSSRKKIATFGYKLPHSYLSNHLTF